MVYIYGYFLYMTENNCPLNENACNYGIAKMQRVWYHASMNFLENPKTKRRKPQ